MSSSINGGFPVPVLFFLSSVLLRESNTHPTDDYILYHRCVLILLPLLSSKILIIPFFF